MEQITTIKQNAEAFRITKLKRDDQSILHQAQLDKLSPLEFLTESLNKEIAYPKAADQQRKLRLANLLKYHDLDYYDFSVFNGLNKVELEQLRELLWLEQNYNLILMGFCGTGKTFIAAGLIYEAV